VAAKPRPARAQSRRKAPSAPGGRQPSSFARLRVLSAVLPIVVLALALAVSYAVWQRERREIERVLKEDFDRRVNDAVSVFRERVQGYEQVLRAVSGLFASSRQVERIDFHTFVRNLKMEIHPGLQGVGYSMLVPPGQLEMHLAAVRAEGFPTYALRPEGERDGIHLGDLLRAAFGGRAQHHRLRLLRRALAPRRDGAGARHGGRGGLEQDQAAGRGRARGPARLSHGVAGVPQRRAARHGAGAAREHRRLDLRRFSMEGLLGSTVGGERGSLALEVFDGSELQGEAASSASSSERVVVDRVGGESSLRLFSAARRVEAGGHTWMVTAQALPNFATPIAISQLQLVTIVGGASSVALALFTWALMRRRLRSLRNREELQLAKDRAEAANRAKSHSWPRRATTCASRRRRWGSSSRRCARWRRSRSFAARRWDTSPRACRWRWRGWGGC
jgi:hypothetical protein